MNLASFSLDVELLSALTSKTVISVKKEGQHVWSSCELKKKILEKNYKYGR